MKKLLLLFIFFCSCTDSNLNHITPLGAHSLVFHDQGFIIDVRADSKYLEVPDKAYVISERDIVNNNPRWIKIYSENKNKRLILCCGEKEEFSTLLPYINKNQLKVFYLTDLEDWKEKGLHVDAPRKLAEE
ncbi:MAG: hypothetical protein CME70_19785 [Halobacteriovorax sp.]|nr:hypothetical protein [Halobacteriovorax sp.]|tara:strand:+ start:19720 stop:20112 length:393 start_codon:yes stop_codon:yes gene_type:complete